MASNRKLYRDTISVFGHDLQINIAVEECAELIQAIQKFKRNKPHNVAEEIADVEIMCRQLSLIFPGVSDAKKRKLIRLQERIDERNAGAIS